MTLIEKVARAIYGEWEDRPDYAKMQMNGIFAEELARAAIVVVLKDMLDACEDERRDMTPHNLFGCVAWYARENGIEL